LSSPATATGRTASAVLDDLERACVEVEKALREQRWDDCVPIWGTQRRLTHELEVALRDVPPESPEREAAMKRVVRVTKYRDGQLRRLRAFNAALGKRLATMERFGRYERTVAEPPAARLLDGNY
jgi:hypothetical protein